MVSSEASPYAKSGGLADVLGALPAALAAIGHRVAVVIPRYQGARTAPARRVIDVLPIRLGGGIYEVGIWELQSAGVTYYFVDHPGLYDRNGLYGDQYGDFGDNHIRYAVLAKAAMEISRLLFPTDIFHCHDWQAGLLPVYLKAAATVDPVFLGARSVIWWNSTVRPACSRPGWCSAMPSQQSAGSTRKKSKPLNTGLGWRGCCGRGPAS